MQPEVLLGLISFAVGVLVGLTSMGAGALMTPMLIMLGGVKPAIAIGTNLVYASATKLIGAGLHWRQSTVDFRIAFLLAIGSVPGGALGVSAARRASEVSDESLRWGIGMVLLFVGCILCLREIVNGSAPGRVGLHVKRWLLPITIGWGAVVGFAVGFSSVGSGSLIVPFLLFFYPLKPAEVVGTDIFHAALVVTATAGLHWRADNVEWSIVPFLLAGSIPGLLLGCRLAPMLPQRALRLTLAIVIVAMAMKLVS